MEESADGRGTGVLAYLKRLGLPLVLAGAVCGLAAEPAGAAFPYPAGINLPRSSAYRLAPGITPTNFSETGDWELSATPSTSPSSQSTVDNQPDQLCGIRGISLVDADKTQPAGCVAGQPVHTAFQVTTGNPDVHIAVLDSGIEWNDPGTMANVANKVWLNTGELPAPRHDLRTPLAPLPGGRTCSSLSGARGGDYNRLGNYWPNGRGGEVGGYYDVLHQGMVDVLDWACDSRVARALYPSSLNHGRTCPGSSQCKPYPYYHGPVVGGHLVLTPEALILAFSDGKDHDHNGFANDIAGWNFVDNDNDPYDDVQYGHGSGEAQDSTAEANTGGTVGTCPNCMIMPLRVGESFVADANRFAQAALYATDMGADVIQEALGTYNAPYFARQAIEYAYHHGTTVIASAADEEAEHHNQPGSLPDTIVVNSVNQPEENVGPVNATGNSYLQLNGCTNFGTRVDLAVEGSSCSSESTGKSSGVTGLIYSAAENALAAKRIRPSGDCRRVNGTPCIITPNEVRQLLASGNIKGDLTPGQGASPGTASADLGTGGQADDVNFAQQPEPSCSSAPSPTCTDPNLNFGTFNASDPSQPGGLIGPDTYQYPARKGFDEFYGYGRLNAYKAVAAVAAGHIPPQADITSPDWFTQIDPRLSSFKLDGYVAARASYTCRVDIAPGAEPNNALAPTGDFHTIASNYCDGKTVHHGSYSGLLAAVSIAHLRSLFPPGNPSSFTGNEDGGIPQDQFGRPNTEPYAFTARVVVSTASGLKMTGEDRRQLFLHRDQQMLHGWPKELQTDGDSTPILADIEGNDRPDLIVATSDGWIHAYRPNGTEAPGWPVHTAALPLHLGEAAYGAGGVGAGHFQAVLGGLAAGDLFHTGQIDVVADDMGGNVYAWNGQGQLVFHAHSNPRWSGRPLSYPSNPVGALHPARSGPRDRTEGGFVNAPVLANLKGGPGPLDIIVAGEDRHLYAWQPTGRYVRGFPVFMEDPDKITAVNPVTNQPRFSTTRAQPHPGISEDQGKIIDTPAVAYVNGPRKPPVIYVGTNEEYTVNTGDEGPINSSDPGVQTIGQSGILTFANGRVYAVKPTGGKMSCSGGRCHSSAFKAGWPVKIGIIDAGLLPDVGEGINGSPVVAPITCTNGGGGMKIGVSPDAGPAYLLNQNGTSCYGSSNGRYNTLQTEGSSGNSKKVDTPAFAAVGYPSFGSLSGSTITMFDQGAGLIRALDVAVNGEQRGGQDFILGWTPSSGQFAPGYPAVANDLGFLTGETSGDVTGQTGRQEVLGGTASLDVQAFNAAGQPASSAWPKLSGDWLVATPTLGPFGSLAYLRSAHKDVVTVTRSGTLSVYQTPAKACSPSSWPNWHHDLANSGDWKRDATPPGVPSSLTLSHRVLEFVAPGGDDECGRAARYQVVTSANPISPGNFAQAHGLSVKLKPAAAGTVQHFTLPRSAQRYVAIRAMDAQGNLGLPAVLDTLGVQGHARPAASCAALGPVSHLAAASGHGGRVTFTGSSVDRSCGRARIERVRISLWRQSGRSCRFVQPGGSLSSPRSC
ncbi:MAG TPA: S8 family serine peptidase, partial [Solirubrobacteraceae bacterium]|nr:S8 family serine peptidase [Solirubrobacteraceae bacterium]